MDYEDKSIRTDLLLIDELLHKVDIWAVIGKIS
jgi:hypothetical protein